MGATPDFQGILTKRGHRKKNWSQRQCRLKGTRIFYFKQGKNKPQGFIDLTGGSVYANSITHFAFFQVQHCFKINCPADKKRMFYMSAPDRDSFIKWVTHIRRNLNQLSHFPPPSIDRRVGDSVES